MNINFKAITIDLTDEIRTYAEEKINMLEKLLKNVDTENIRAEIELERHKNKQEGKIFRADITIHAGANRTHAVGHGESILSAIDEAKDELARRLRRDKNRSKDMFLKGASRIKKMLRFWE